jgi:hypothetical protein
VGPREEIDIEPVNATALSICRSVDHCSRKRFHVQAQIRANVTEGVAFAGG